MSARPLLRAFSSPTLYTIANDLSQMQVLTTVDESDIGRISMGQEATFTVDSTLTKTSGEPYRRFDLHR